MYSGGPPKIVILSSGNLFAEGVANRLREYAQELHIDIINPVEVEYSSRLEAIGPSVVILNASETDIHNRCLMCDLIANFPNKKIVRLTEDQGMVQVIRNSQYSMESVHDLVEMILHEPWDRGPDRM
jgi:hypothetical protein